jgi:hypothetical protein
MFQLIDYFCLLFEITNFLYFSLFSILLTHHIHHLNLIKRFSFKSSSSEPPFFHHLPIDPSPSFSAILSFPIYLSTPLSLSLPLLSTSIYLFHPFSLFSVFLSFFIIFHFNFNVYFTSLSFSI